MTTHSSPADSLSPDGAEGSTKDRRVRLAALLVILTAGLLLRLVSLQNIPPGLCPDEAIEALQGDALRHGDSLPAVPLRPYPRWPLWCGLEALVSGLAGNSVSAIRLPAVLAGLLSVVLAFPVGRLLGGPLSGLAAGAFLSFSFWHVTYSRMALPCVLVVAETMAVAAILFRPSPLSSKSGAVLALISAAASLGYAASLVTPLLAVFLIVLRLVVRPAGRREDGLALGFAAAALPLALAVAAARPGNTVMIAAIGMHTPADLARQAWLIARNAVLTVPAPWGHHTNFPPGHPRFVFTELILITVGAVAVARGRGIPGWRRTAVLGWSLISLSPEVFGGGGINLIRGLPELGPAAILAGLGAGAISRTAGRTGIAVVAAILFMTGLNTAGREFGPSAVYRRAAAWPSAVEAAAAARLRELAGASGMYLHPAPDYLNAPVLTFHLIDALRSSRISGTTAAPGRSRVETVFHDPATGQPVLLLLIADRPLRGRMHAGLESVSELLDPARNALKRGRHAEAEKLARRVLALAPDSASARDILEQALASKKATRTGMPESRPPR